MLLGPEFTLTITPVAAAARQPRKPCTGGYDGGHCYCYACYTTHDERRRSAAGPTVTYHVLHRSGEYACSQRVPVDMPAADRLALVRQLRAEVIADLRQVRRERKRASADTCGTVRVGRERATVRDLLARGPDWKVALVGSRRGPQTPARHVAVELEFGAPPDVDVALALARHDVTLASSLGYDGSVSVPGCANYELRLCAPETEIVDVVRRACAALASVGAKVNKTCGLHVHLDCRARNPRIAGQRLVKAMPWLYAIVAPSRRSNQYCARVNRLPARQDGRYHAVNVTAAYARHRTIEVRLHHGTVDAGKITAWIKLLLAIVNTVPPRRMPRDLYGFAAAYRLPLDLTTYIAARAAQLGGARLEGLEIPSGTAIGLAPRLELGEVIAAE